MSTLTVPDLESALAALSLNGPIQQFTEADVLRNPLDLCRAFLAELVCSLVDCELEVAIKSIQWPNNIFLGDLAIIVPRLRLTSNPNDVTVNLINKFPNDHALFFPPVPEGVHLRVFVKPEAFSRLMLPFILDRKTTYGNDTTLGLPDPSCPPKGRKKLLIEFSSPNIHSEFLGKHLRSTILGAFVARLYENMGWEVTRINHLGDWGNFLGLLKVGWERFGDEEAYQANPVGHLLHVYHQIEEQFRPEEVASKQARDDAAKDGHDTGNAQADIENQGIYAERNAAFKKLEEGDEDAVAFWKRVRDANIENYKDFYSQLGIQFDEYTGESQVSLDVIAEVEQKLKEKSICEESADALVVHMQNYGLKAGTAIVRNRNGGTTYLLRDLAAVLERSRKFEFDKMIIVAANDYNSQHFTHLHHILKALDMEELANKVQHLKFGEVPKMAENLDKGYLPQAIISHCQEAMAASLKANQEKASLFRGSIEDAQTLGITALLTHELSNRTAASHAFDTATMSAFKPGTGPTLQYWYAKVCSLLKENVRGVSLSDEDFNSIVEDDEANLLRVLVQYPEIVHVTHQSLEPSSILIYLGTVIEQLEECFSEEDGEDDAGEEADSTVEVENKGKSQVPTLTPGHVALYEATRIVLENGMRLLGITPYASVEPDRADTPIAE